MANQNKNSSAPAVIIKNITYVILFLAIILVSFLVIFNVEFEEMIRFALFFILVFFSIDLFKKLREETIVKK